PPSPPEGGSPPDSILVEETYVTGRGRERRRPVRIDLDEVRRGLGIPSAADRNDWEQIRKRLREVAGDSTFEIWLKPLELIAIDPTRALVIASPAATSGWVAQRFAQLLARCAEQQARALRLAAEPERRAVGRQDRASSPAVGAVHINQQEVS
ncbi:MAG: DnaA N-terminal domain-containing protein, partial [Solirubrobacteraceae bacterium]